MDNKISINKIIADIKATKGNRSGCQGLHSSLESDGYITSICKWTRATSPERIDALIEHIEKQEAALIAWEKTMMEVCGEDSPASVANEILALRALRDTALAALMDQIEQLAAENVGLKRAAEFATASDMWEDLGGDVYRYQYVDWYVGELRTAMETPATDRIVAEAEARGVEKFAAEQRGVAERLKKRGGDVVMSSIKFCLESAEEAEVFAQQLREGADK